MKSRRYATVKDFARALGCADDTVRLYEAKGIIPAAMRHPANGYRLWRHEQVAEAAVRLEPRRFGASV